jgi:DNA invertase Pin-like site-specific DNA recombinase
MSGRIIGYARVSTTQQELDSQIDDLRAAGCIEIFTDKESGSKEERKGLEACYNALKAGDTLVVWRLDRLGRSMSHLVAMITNLKKRQIDFRSLRDGEGLDTTSASGQLIFHIFAALAQFESSLIKERTKAGLEAARARGRKGGRKPIPSYSPKVQMAKRQHADGSMSVPEICSVLNISKATLYRYLAM